MTSARKIVERFVSEDDGQDIVEYALLAALFAVVGYLAVSGIGAAVLATYTSWENPASGVPSLWDPAAPAGS